MSTIAYLACATTVPGSGERRGDAFEHDLMIEAIEPALAKRGLTLRVIDWEAPLEEFDGVTLAMIGTTRNYWDKAQVFLDKLDALRARGISLCNPLDLVRWNITKTYLRELEANGARTIPTLWVDEVTPSHVADGFRALGSDDVVWKRQVGAGASGQHRLSPRDDVPAMPHAMMAQPFLPTIQTEGELSFIYIDGEFCHALLKRAAQGDYRIQSAYGGVEEAITPDHRDRAAANAVLAMLDTLPLYARVDMVRNGEGDLLLMELELIEPFLYPLQGPELGPRMAAALKKRLNR